MTNETFMLPERKIPVWVYCVTRLIKNFLWHMFSYIVYMLAMYFICSVQIKNVIFVKMYVHLLNSVYKLTLHHLYSTLYILKRGFILKCRSPLVSPGVKPLSCLLNALPKPAWEKFEGILKKPILVIQHGDKSTAVQKEMRFTCFSSREFHQDTSTMLLFYHMHVRNGSLFFDGVGRGVGADNWTKIVEGQEKMIRCQARIQGRWNCWIFTPHFS